MTMPNPMTAEEAHAALGKADPLNPVETAQLLRYLKRSNDDLVGKLRQLKSEMGRMGRK
ncbi:hypothetical protein LBMAG53_23730 [Planctomycetota bacterium]|nr:hypothetical protein LBMAG53_23730 [Planctomycetota bacterium]